MKFYEFRDTSDDELYYPVGYFTDYNPTLKEILSSDKPEEFLSEYTELGCNSGYEISIIEHEMDAWSTDGRTVGKILITQFYSEDEDEYHYDAEYKEKD